MRQILETELWVCYVEERRDSGGESTKLTEKGVQSYVFGTAQKSLLLL